MRFADTEKYRELDHMISGLGIWNVNVPERIKRQMESIIHAVANDRANFLLPGNENSFTRRRKLCFEDVVWTIIAMGGKSIAKELFDANIDVSASAFVQQRGKISYELFGFVFDELVKHLPSSKTVDGYRLLAVDGSDVNTPYNEESEFYNPSPLFKKNGLPVRGFNSVHLNSLYDITNHIFIDAEFGRSEAHAAYRMIDRYHGRKAIIIADRAYPSYAFLAHCQLNPSLEYLVRVPNAMYNATKFLPDEELDIDNLFRVSTKTFKWCQLNGYSKVVPPSPKGKKIKTVTWDLPMEKMEIPTRIVRFRIDSSGEDSFETVFTSLPREQFPVSKIKELYNKRWQIETRFREVKHNVGMINFHTKKDNGVLQEIYAALIMLNIATAIIGAIKLTKAKFRKYEYVPDRALAIHVIKAFFHLRNGPPRLDGQRVERAIREHLQPIRPGRSGVRNMRQQHAVSFQYRPS